MADLSVKLCGLTLDNPVIPASGCFGYGKEFSEYYDINILGSFSFKGTTRYPKDGNEQPRIAECYSGMLNSVGLQNPGIHRVIEHELPEMKKNFNLFKLTAIIVVILLLVISFAGCKKEWTMREIFIKQIFTKITKHIL